MFLRFFDFSQSQNIFSFSSLLNVLRHTTITIIRTMISLALINELFVNLMPTQHFQMVNYKKMTTFLSILASVLLSKIKFVKFSSLLIPLRWLEESGMKSPCYYLFNRITTKKSLITHSSSKKTTLSFTLLLVYVNDRIVIVDILSLNSILPNLLCIIPFKLRT